jgi:hypothetical protein
MTIKTPMTPARTIYEAVTELSLYLANAFFLIMVSAPNPLGSNFCHSFFSSNSHSIQVPI